VVISLGFAKDLSDYKHRLLTLQTQIMDQPDWPKRAPPVTGHRTLARDGKRTKVEVIHCRALPFIRSALAAMVHTMAGITESQISDHDADDEDEDEGHRTSMASSADPIWPQEKPQEPAGIMRAATFLAGYIRSYSEELEVSKDLKESSEHADLCAQQTEEMGERIDAMHDFLEEWDTYGLVYDVNDFAESMAEITSAFEHLLCALSG
jgi:hypothetical protein